jgi:WhiB family redox-sensing transcriptional regulator
MRAAEWQPSKGRHIEHVDDGCWRTNDGRPDWRDDAACRDTEPELFFPEGDNASARVQVKQAKLICRSCLVSAACLNFALACGQEAGIWGGMTEDERRRLNRRGRPLATGFWPR